MKSQLFRSKTVRSLVRNVVFGILGVTSIFGVVAKSNAATVYPIVNNQVVRFELSNGVALNIQNASLANDKFIYSFTGNNSDPEQHFKVISNGDGYNFQRNGSSYSLSASTLTPTNLSPAVAYQSGFGQWQDFWLDDAPGGGYYLIKWRKNPAYCLNIPGSKSNVKITFFACNASDNDQRFRVVNIANQQYVNPIANGAVGVLEAASGQRITIPGNNVAPGLAYPNDNDQNQKIQFLQVGGNQYVFQKANTNYALSSNTLDYVTANTAGMAMTTYNTGAGRWQNFGLVSLGNDWYQVKYAWNPNFCVSAGTNSGSLLGVIVTCNSGDNRQRFRVNTMAVSYQDMSTSYYYAVLASGAGGTFISDPTQSGHTWSGVFKVTKNERRKFVNSILDSTQLLGYTTEKQTLSAWQKYQTVPIIAGTEDMSWLQNYIDGTPNTGFIYRLKSISSQTYASALTTYTGQTGCVGYATIRTSINQTCNCSRASVNYWFSVTGESFTGVVIPYAVQNWIGNLQNNQTMLFIKP